MAATSFLIAGVKYRDEFMVSALISLSDNGGKSAYEISRAKLQEALRAGFRFSASNQGADGSWTQLGNVHSVRLHGTDYIKLHDDTSCEDDLGDVAQY